MSKKTDDKMLKELKYGKRPRIIGVHHEATPAQRRQGIRDEATGKVKLRHLWDK